MYGSPSVPHLHLVGSFLTFVEIIFLMQVGAAVGSVVFVFAESIIHIYAPG